MADIERIMTKHDLKTRLRTSGNDIITTAAVAPGMAVVGAEAGGFLGFVATATTVSAAVTGGLVAGIALPFAYLIYRRRSGKHDYEIIKNRSSTKLTINYRKQQ